LTDAIRNPEAAIEAFRNRLSESMEAAVQIVATEREADYALGRNRSLINRRSNAGTPHF
jgi:hypothetical protein